jgi:hypothetical protein
MKKLICFVLLGCTSAFGAAPAGSIVVDSDAGDTSVVMVGSWSYRALGSGNNGTYDHDGDADKGTKSVELIPTLPSSSTYNVYLNWVSHDNRASNVPVTITYDGGSTTVTVNQQENGDWVLLGTFPFVAGTSGSVLIETTDTDGYVIADAAAWVEVTDPGDEYSGGSVFVHPGMVHKGSDLDRMKAMVEAQIEPWYTSYQTMCAESKASFDYTVLGDTSMKVLYRDSPYTNKSAFESDSRAAYYNALRWYIEGDSRYAAKAVEIFNAWTGLEYLQHSGTRALTSCLVYQMLEAAEMIKSTYTGWAEEDIQTFKDMLVYPGYSNTEAPDNLMVDYEDGGEGTWYWRAYLFDSGRAGNQEASAMRACMAMGIFLDNEIMYDRALRYVKGLPHRDDDLAYASGPNTRTSLISSNEYRISYNATAGYDIEDYGFNGVLTNYIYANGQAQESSRDAWHTWWGMHLLANCAEMAWSQGDDLWSEADSRILTGAEYHNKWSVSYLYSYDDQPEPWNPTAESGEFIQGWDRTSRNYSLGITPYVGDDTNYFYRTKYNEVACWELLTGHYVGRGLKTEEEAKWAIRARDTSIERNGNYETKPASGNGSYLGYGGLTYRRPADCYGEPISGFDTNGLPVYALNQLPGTIEAENYDQTTGDGNGRTYHDLTTTNSGGAYRSDDVDIAAHEGGYSVTDLEAGEWLSYTVNVPETRDYRLSIRYAGQGATVRFAFGGSDVTEDIELPSTGSSTNWKTFAVGQQVSLTNSVQSMRIYVAGGDFELDRIVVSEDDGEVLDDVLIDTLSVGEEEILMSVENSETGLSYLVKSTDSLTESEWQAAGELVDGNGGELILSVPVSEAETNQYYKLEAWR